MRAWISGSASCRRGGERFNGPDEVVPFELDVEWSGVDNCHLAGSIVLDIDQGRAAHHETRAGVV